MTESTVITVSATMGIWAETVTLPSTRASVSSVLMAACAKSAAADTHPCVTARRTSLDTGAKHL